MADDNALLADAAESIADGVEYVAHDVALVRTIIRSLLMRMRCSL